jgi:hypothetical protein
VRRYLFLAVLLLVPVSVSAQDEGMAIGVGLSASTMGIGVDGAVQLMSRVAVRGRVAFLPYEPEFDVGNNRFTVELPSPQIGIFADLSVAGPLRLTGGLRYSASDPSGTAIIAANENVDIGNGSYTGAQVGTLAGAIETSAMAPYIGLGVGSVAGRGFGMFIDVGAAFHGTPTVDLKADGSLSSQQSFQADLQLEEDAANEDLEDFKIYPVIGFGFRIGV